MKYRDVIDPNEVFECERCGSLVVNQTRHNFWHSQISGLLEELATMGKTFVEGMESSALMFGGHR